MRRCLKCGEEKELQKFRKRQRWYSHTCKSCYASEYRTGRENTGRFIKGCKPLKPFQKGNIPWNKGKVFSERRNPNAGKYKVWRNQVLERDNKTCQQCGSKEKLHCHHIKPWKENEELRFDVSNGQTLCISCHSKIEGVLLKVGLNSRFKKGHKHSLEVIKKLSESNKGRVSWNKGKKLSDEHRKKLSESHKGKIPWNKRIKDGFRE